MYCPGRAALGGGDIMSGRTCELQSDVGPMVPNACLQDDEGDGSWISRRCFRSMLSRWRLMVPWIAVWSSY